MISFNEKDIFLTAGASSGIGKSISLKLNELGASVVAIARSEDKLNDLRREADYPDNIYIESKDLTDSIGELDKYVGLLAEKYGKFRGLAYSAGVQYTLPLQADNYQKSRNLFDINFFAAQFMTKGFAKKKNNIGSGASIVIISSFTSLIGAAGISSYAASKGALNSFVKSCAMEIARSGVRINSVLPGHIATGLTKEDSGLSDAFYKKLEEKYPLGLGETSDVANAACFLLSDSSKWITGSQITIDGGASIYF